MGIVGGMRDNLFKGKDAGSEDVLPKKLTLKSPTRMRLEQNLGGLDV